MKIIKNDIRPIGYCTIELSDAEIQTIVGVIEDNCFIYRRPLKEIGGIAQEIYNKFLLVLTKMNS